MGVAALGNVPDATKLRLTALAQASMTGGGVKRFVPGPYVKWNGRFICISHDRSALVPSGFFQIDMPPSGTVITRLSGGTTTVDEMEGILLPDTFGSLYYRLPYGQAFTSVPGNFLLTDYNAGNFTLPDDAVLIAVGQGDADSSMIKWGTGELSDWWHPLTLQNSWVPQSVVGVNTQPEYIKRGDRVYVRGMIKNGVVTAETIVTTLPLGYRPKIQHHFGTSSNNAFGSVGVRADGAIVFKAGSNAWFSLDGISFQAEVIEA